MMPATGLPAYLAQAPAAKTRLAATRTAGDTPESGAYPDDLHNFCPLHP